MKNSRFKFEYRESASSLHKTVGELLRTSDIFGYHDIYQEYPVNRINETYFESSHHFDWVIPKLFLVIECHGKQHYENISFTSNVDESISQFKDLKRRDKAKKEAAMKAGFIYIEVPYFEEKKLTIDKLLQMIDKGKEELVLWQEEYAIETQDVIKQEDSKLKRKEEEKQRQKEKRQEYLNSDKHKKELALAKEYRKQKYKANKEKQNG